MLHALYSSDDQLLCAFHEASIPDRLHLEGTRIGGYWNWRVLKLEWWVVPEKWKCGHRDDCLETWEIVSMEKMEKVEEKSTMITNHFL